MQPLLRLEAGARTIREALNRGQRVALLFGSEKFGLSNDDMSHCHLLLRIPTRDEHPSMNLGQAAALCLYELARMDTAPSAPGYAAATQPRWELPQNFPRAAEPGSPASADTLERIAALLEQALAASDYPGMGPAARTRQLRALLRRLSLSERDGGLFTGFLRQMLWKLRGLHEPLESESSQAHSGNAPARGNPEQG